MRKSNSYFICNFEISIDMRKNKSERLSALKASIQQGFDSGVALDFNPAEHLKALMRSKAKNIRKI